MKLHPKIKEHWANGLYILIIMVCSVIIGITYLPIIRLLTIDRNSDFIKIAPSVYVGKNTPNTEIDSLKQLIVRGNKKLNRFWGSVEGKPTIIYCNTDELFNKFEDAETTNGCVIGLKYVVLSKNGLNLQTVTHELCHVEIHKRSGENYVDYRKIPIWFHEGLAMRVSRDLWCYEM